MNGMMSMQLAPWLKWLIVVVVGVVVLTLGYMWGAGERAAVVEEEETTETATTESEDSEKISDWETYTNSKYSYSFDYPETLSLSASLENSNDLPISGTAEGVNVYSPLGLIGNGIFFVNVPNIDFTTEAIKNQFGATSADNITTNAVAISGSDAFKVNISGDDNILSTFYFIKSPSGTVLQLTVVNSSTDAQKILATFKFTTE